MKRGRKSVAALAVVTSMDDARPAPPDRLIAEAAEIWRATVSRLPRDWFTVETLPLLEAYCGHVVTARRLTDQIDTFKSAWFRAAGGVERFAKMLAARERETKAMVTIGRALRITKAAQTAPQQAYRQSRNAGSSGKRPWDPV